MVAELKREKVKGRERCAYEHSCRFKTNTGPLKMKHLCKSLWVQTEWQLSKMSESSASWSEWYKKKKKEWQKDVIRNSFNADTTDITDTVSIFLSNFKSRCASYTCIFASVELLSSLLGGVKQIGKSTQMFCLSQKIWLGIGLDKWLDSSTPC